MECTTHSYVGNDICVWKCNFLLHEIYHMSLKCLEPESRAKIPCDFTYCKLRFSTQVSVEVVVQLQGQVLDSKCACTFMLGYEDLSARTHAKCK